MRAEEINPLIRRLQCAIAGSTQWKRVAGLSVCQGSLRLNQVLQAVSLLLVALLALPLVGKYAKGLTTPLTDVVAGRSDGGDFIAFYAAGRLYAANRDASPYDLQRLSEAEFEVNPSHRFHPVWVNAGGVNPFRNPPFYLPVVGYLARFSLPVGFALTTVIQAAFLGGLLAITAGLASARALPLAAVTWITLCLGYYPVWQGFTYAQLPAYIVALAFAGGVRLLRAERSVWAGLLLALLWLKLQYVVPLVLFLLVVKERRALLGLVIGSLVLLLLSLALVGPGGMRLYLETTISLARAPRGLYFANYEWMFNWRALLERTLANSYPGLIFPGQLVLTVLTYGLAVWAWLAPTHGAGWRCDARTIVLALMMILASPHVHGQDMTLLLPAAALVMGYLWSEGLPWLVTAASALGLLLFFWIVPQQVQSTPTLNFSVLLLAFLFLGSVFMLRGGPAAYAVYRRPVIQSS